MAAVALMLSTLSFAAGVAGDLSVIDPPTSGQRVVLRLPPELPTDTPRAGPLNTAAAAAAVLPRRPRQLRVEAAPESIEPAEKPRTEQVHFEAKPDPDRAPKPENA